ncbi:hypothetical protein [Phenylobacterium sp.]|uniref:hypothetical protein n=1 Tax=Phenylobacterium sp. TaxID=1871053 RepID=UPI003D2CD2ED
MKHAVLASIAHNIADSLASGIGMMIGMYEMDVFGEAAASPNGYIEVDFLTGAATGAKPSAYLAQAIRLYAEALPDLCERQGAHVSDFQQLTARYAGKSTLRGFVVTVTDRRGRTSRASYVGTPGQRAKVLDPLGRIRRARRFDSDTSPATAPPRDATRP